MNTPTLPALLERFFIDRLMRQRHVSANTIASYRDTFRLPLVFTQKQLGKPPSSLNLEDIDATLVSAFLEDLEVNRSISARTRNLRLTAIRSFFRFVSYEEPAHSAQIQRVLAVPDKRQDRRIVHFLARPEIEALLAAPDQSTWIGRRDHTLLLLAVQTGLRLSELTGLDRASVVLGSGAHVHCLGKGRKERCTPLTRTVSRAIQEWLKEPARCDSKALFSTRQGRRLSADAVQYLVANYADITRQHCPSLKQKRITPHVLRHSAAMELLQAGVDCSVIALWLGHESVETTQVYLHAHMALKEAALAKIDPLGHAGIKRYQPGDELLAFLNNL
ncbi:tyrosine-type recombinase/integrase [Marinobacter sp. ELB17]|uniref:tyrosine-type recombinase/integrase n=1 Tax=Marinobacter sp. ELB17 TaxID=270374 RepID=UPI0000F39C5C|nr:tyrosine-type recombinase/integrase [Marinobacter sp. ELB17]EAZ97437.1 putative integrase [Marinobacter sp. ELB17]